MDNEQLPKGYKHTEVGVIPEDWEVKKLGDIGENIIGLTYSPNDVKSYGHLVLRSSNIQNNKLAFENNVFVEMELPNRVIVKENDILICVRNGSKHLIGKCALIDKATEGSAFGAFMSVYRTKNAEFIFHQFQSNIIQKQIDEVMGATINQLTNKDLSTFQIPLPKEDKEQTAIATALSDADALINSLEKLIAKKRNIKQGAMQHLLKPKEGWEVKKLGEIAAFFKGKGLPKSHLKENGKYKCIHYGELFTKYKESISSILSYTNENENCFFSISNDVLMPTSDVTPNGLATASCIKQDGIILGGDVLVIRILPSILDGLFLSFYVSQNREKVMKLVSGSTVYHLYGSDMKDFEISYPKTEQQNEIATILSDMDAEIQALETKLEKYRKIKLGMMQVLLTGKVRLV